MNETKISKVTPSLWMAAALLAVALALTGTGSVLAADPVLKGELILRFAHQGAVTETVFSPDGAMIATTGDDRTIKLWNAGSGALLKTLQGDQPSAMIFTPDGKILITGDAAGIQFWDTATGLAKTIMAAPATVRDYPYVQALDISPDGTRLLSGARMDVARVWNVATGQMETALPIETKGATRVAFAAGGKQAMVGHGLETSRTPETVDSASTARWWDIETGAALPTTVGDNLKLLAAIAPQSGQLVFKQEDREDVQAFGRTMSNLRVTGTTLSLWDAATGTARTAVKAPGFVHSLTYSRNSKFLAGIVGTNRITVWDTTTGAVNSQATMPGTIQTAALSPDGTEIAGGDRDGSVTVQPVAGGAPRWSVVGASGEVTGVGVLPDGKTIVSGQRSGITAVWNAMSGRLVKAIPAPDRGVSALALSPDGKTLAIAVPFKQYTMTMEANGETSGRIDLLDTATWTVRRSLSSPARFGFESLAFSPDSHLIAASGHDMVLLWDAMTGEQKPLPGRFIMQNGLAFSPSGTLFAVGQNGIPIYDLPAFVRQEREPGIGGNHNWPVFSADSKSLITASESGGLEFWKMQGSDQERYYASGAKERHPKPITAIAVSSDGQWIASGDMDGTIILWDAATREKKATLIGHHGPVSGLQFWPGSAKLLSGSRDGTIRIWNVPEGRLILSAAAIPLPPSDATGVINWAAWTPDGYYDASPGAAPYLSWLVDGQTRSDEPTRTAFHRPALVAAALR